MNPVPHEGDWLDGSDVIERLTNGDCPYQEFVSFWVTRDWYLEKYSIDAGEGSVRHQWASLLPEGSLVRWDHHGVMQAYERRGNEIRWIGYLNDTGYRAGRMVGFDGKIYAEPTFPGCANYLDKE